MSPGGVGGTRASVQMAVRTNLRRSNEGSAFQQKTLAVATTLRNRYLVIGQHFDERVLTGEAAPMALSEVDLPDLVAEYIVDLEFPGRALPWLSDAMPRALEALFTSKDSEHRAIVGGIFLLFNDNQVTLPHWKKWITEELIGEMYDTAMPVLRARYPDKFGE